MSTNQAFIKAYRHDRPAAAAATPSPTSLAHQAAPAVPLTALQSTVEIAVAEYHWPTPSLTTAAIPAGAIGKRPLSSFTAESIGDPLPAAAEPGFAPATTLSAFCWPRICRALWEQFADEYERVAGILLTRCGREPGRGGVIGVTGLHSGDGATTTALCLAVALAARNAAVILVDGNFRSPRLATFLGVEPTATWQDILEHGLPIADGVIRAERDGVDLLPLSAEVAEGREPNGAKLAAGMQTFITAGVLRYAYEIVLVDLGAILAPRSFATMSHLIRNLRIDAVVAVTDPKHAEPDDLTVAGELLDESGCELLGVIENRTAKPQAAEPPRRAAN